MFDELNYAELAIRLVMLRKQKSLSNKGRNQNSPITWKRWWNTRMKSEVIHQILVAARETEQYRSEPERQLEEVREYLKWQLIDGLSTTSGRKPEHPTGLLAPPLPETIKRATGRPGSYDADSLRRWGDKLFGAAIRQWGLLNLSPKINRDVSSVCDTFNSKFTTEHIRRDALGPYFPMVITSVGAFPQLTRKMRVARARKLRLESPLPRRLKIVGGS